MKKLYKGLAGGGALLAVGLVAGGALGSSAEGGSHNITLSVDCTNGGPNVAAAGGLNDSQEMNITLETPQGKLNMTAQLGKYSIDGINRQQYPAGTIIANLGSANVIAGAPNTATNSFYQANQSVTLICDGVQPKNVIGGY